MKVQLHIALIFLGIAISFSCRSKPAIEKEMVLKSHWIELKRPSVGTLYIDSVPLRSVMKVRADSNDETKFRAYLVGFSDSVIVNDNAKHIDNNKYYEYDMQNDWTAIEGERSCKPVFYQSRMTGQRTVNGGILVFETNNSLHPDTLIYKDTHGNWGTQKFILKGE